MTTTDERLAQIRARLAAMLPGRWEPSEVVESKDWALGLRAIRDEDGGLCCLLPNHGWPEQRANADFIANAPADVLALLAALDAATARAAEWEQRANTAADLVAGTNEAALRDAARLAAADALQSAVTEAILVLGAADDAYDAARLAATNLEN